MRVVKRRLGGVREVIDRQFVSETDESGCAISEQCPLRDIDDRSGAVQPAGRRREFVEIDRLRSRSACNEQGGTPPPGVPFCTCVIAASVALKGTTSAASMTSI